MIRDLRDAARALRTDPRATQVFDTHQEAAALLAVCFDQTADDIAEHVRTVKGEPGSWECEQCGNPFDADPESWCDCFAEWHDSHRQALEAVQRLAA